MNYVGQSVERNLQILNNSYVFQVLLCRRKYRDFENITHSLDSHSFPFLLQTLKAVSQGCSLKICSKAVLKMFAKSQENTCASLYK